MNKDLIDGARELFADELFETVRRCYCEANKDYLNKQVNRRKNYGREALRFKASYAV